MITLSAMFIAGSIVMALNGKELLCLLIIVAIFSFPQLLLLIVIGSALFSLLRK